MNYSKRQNRLRALLGSRSIGAILVRKKENISYLAGTKGDDAILFFSGRKNFLLTDSRYEEEYRQNVKGCRIVIAAGRDACACIEEISRKARSQRIGFESANFSYSEYTDLKKKLRKAILVPVKGVVESLRTIKDKDEVRLIRKACRDGSDVMNYAMRAVMPGLSEQSVKNRVASYIAKKGIDKAGFDIIVASGKNASLPHASASGKRIKKGEMVVIDLGTINCGYNSDLTRTVFLGRIDRKYLSIYNIVLDAQKKAIENIKPGVPAKYIDRISRQYISNKGLGRYFIHSLGHGIGLEGHEAPRVSKASAGILRKNMTLTIEPGVYIPGWGGIRIEDVALVTENGCEVLTKGCKKDYAGRD